MLPHERYQNENWTAEQSEALFEETVASLSECAPRVSIHGVICDALPASVSGFLQSLRNTVRIHSAIMLIRCLSHIVNLVFTQAIKSHFCSEGFAMQTEIVRTLHSAQSIHLLNLRCPKLIERNGSCDILAFLIDEINDVQTALALRDRAPIIAAHHRAHLVLFPLSVFSRAMECRSHLLWEVILEAREVPREWSEVYEYFGDLAEIRNCLNIVSAHFLARLKHCLRWHFEGICIQSFPLFGNSRHRARFPDAG
jgi:hypothetical protein